MKTLYNIINFKDNATETANNLKTENSENLYAYASEHCVIPTLKNAIKDKDLKNNFPEDFIEAVNYITELNLSRNKIALKQIKHISEIFNDNAINYVFLKGSAMLITNLYRAQSDRMIGDIDILVAKNDITKANTLLLKENYSAADYVIPMYFTAHRHLPRLTSKDWPLAVELHHGVLGKSQNIFLPINILSEKRNVDGITIPSKKHMLYHCILSDMVNDFGYLRWTFTYRAMYDYLVLNKNNYTNLLNTNNKYLRRFIVLKFLHFKDENIDLTAIEKMKIKFFKWRAKRSKINAFYYYLIVKWYTIPKLPVRFLNLIINPKYLAFTLKKTIAFFRKIVSQKSN